MCVRVSGIYVLGVRYMCVTGQVYGCKGSGISVLGVRYMCAMGQVYVC